jgi:hypothetical protein
VKKELLFELVGQRKTLSQIESLTGKSRTTVRYWLRKHGFKLKSWGKIGRLSAQELASIVDSSLSVTECLRKLALPGSGGSFTLLKRRIADLAIPTAHFISHGRVLGSSNVGLTLREFQSHLCLNSSLSQKRLRKYLKHFDLLPYLCKACDQSNVWNGHTLVLELDHIDGNKTDCRLSNLRWLCPNCHSQTSTYGRRNGAASVIA